MSEFFFLLSQISRADSALILAVLGLFLGSFYNVCVDRYLTGESIVYPPSHCEVCSAPLRAWELIPVISWLMLRGRCAHCHARISIQYPLMEILCSGIFALIGWKVGLSLKGITLLVFSSLFLILSAIDFKSYLLPDRFTLTGAFLAIPASIYGLGNSPLDSLLGALIGSVFFWLLGEIFKRLRGVDGLGLGDVKLMLMLGALTTWVYLSMAIFIAAFSALLVFFVMAIGGYYQGKLKQTPLPFGPFLCFGTWITLLYGPFIWQTWFNLVVG